MRRVADGLNDERVSESRGKLQSNIPQRRNGIAKMTDSTSPIMPQHQSSDWPCRDCGRSSCPVPRPPKTTPRMPRMKAPTVAIRTMNHHDVHGAIARASQPLLDNDDPENEGEDENGNADQRADEPGCSRPGRVFAGAHRAGWRGQVVVVVIVIVTVST